ncbi:MAG: hypothetical protein LBV69_10140 [Bacteroidales bacterium]|jgi:hypothetical protein|nr:hypothetical protein [Bacteroidales bacterium]
MKKTQNKENINICDVTKLYATYHAEKKAIEEQMKIQKELILKYVDANSDDFIGKTMVLENGVSVEMRKTKKAIFDESQIDLKWLENATELGIDEMIEFKVDCKKMPNKLNKYQLDLLSEIDFNIEYSQTYAVVVK